MDAYPRRQPGASGLFVELCDGLENCQTSARGSARRRCRVPPDRAQGRNNTIAEILGDVSAESRYRFSRCPKLYPRERWPRTIDACFAAIGGGGPIGSLITGSSRGDAGVPPAPGLRPLQMWLDVAPTPCLRPYTCSVLPGCRPCPERVHTKSRVR